MKTHSATPARKFLFSCLVLAFIMFLFVKPTTALANDETETTDIRFNVKSKSLTVDSEFTLKVYHAPEESTVVFESDDSEIASVSSKGVIKAKKLGETTIRAAVKDGSKTLADLECSVTVGPSAISAVFSRDAVVLTVGSRTTLKVVLKPKNTVEEAVFSSSDSDVATISSTGRVTARSAGTAVMFAKIANGKFDHCFVTVIEPKEEQE